MEITKQDLENLAQEFTDYYNENKKPNRANVSKFIVLMLLLEETINDFESYPQDQLRSCMRVFYKEMNKDYSAYEELDDENIN